MIPRRVGFQVAHFMWSMLHPVGFPNLEVWWAIARPPTQQTWAWFHPIEEPLNDLRPAVQVRSGLECPVPKAIACGPVGIQSKKDLHHCLHLCRSGPKFGMFKPRGPRRPSSSWRLWGPAVASGSATSASVGAKGSGLALGFGRITATLHRILQPMCWSCQISSATVWFSSTIGTGNDIPKRLNSLWQNEHSQQHHRVDAKRVAFKACYSAK